MKAGFEHGAAAQDHGSLSNPEGHNAAIIFKVLNYPKATVYCIIKAFEESGKESRKTHKLRSDCKRTPMFVAGLKRCIKANPDRPFTTLVKERNVSMMTISRAVRLDLGFKSYALKVKHLLIDSMKVN